MSEDASRTGLDPRLVAQALDRLSLVGQGIAASLEFADIFAAVERHVGVLLDAATLYIGLLDESRRWIDVPLFVDGGRRSASRRFAVDDPARPACLCVRENREILVEKTLEEAIRNDIPGTAPTLTALFRPLVVQNRMIGVMSVQSARPHAYGERERLVFRALCSYVAVALANAESFRRLAAMESLEALGEVGQEITSTLRVEDIFESLARHVGRLFDAAAFHVGLLDRDGTFIDRPFLMTGGMRGALPRIRLDDPDAPDARAVREGRELALEHGREGGVPGLSGMMASLLRPISARERPLGLIGLHTGQPGGFGGPQVLLFRTLCNYVAIAIANARAFEEAEIARAAATSALDELRRTQDSLIQAEKMASLGQLVAGIAHEVNTPVGTALTVATGFERIANEFRARSQDAPLRRSELAAFVDGAGEAARQLTLNLMRASDLVGRFKEVAADRSSDERRLFRLTEIVGAILTSLTSELRRHPHAVEVAIPPGIEIDSFPGALGQILINLVMNALVHAFPPGSTGTLRIEAEALPPEMVRIVVRDDGIGIPAADRSRIFEPFFTTRRSRGGTGLGLHIAFNLAAKTLGGRLACRSEPGAGSDFTLEIPLCPPATAQDGAATSA